MIFWKPDNWEKQLAFFCVAAALIGALLGAACMDEYYRALIPDNPACADALLRLNNLADSLATYRKETK